MLNKFISFIKKNQLFELHNKLLLAISGGIDSMVLLDLMMKVNANFAVAHCNFKLRGEDSDNDELLVSDFCEKKNLFLYKIQFETQNYAYKKKISIQMAARELRFNWFQELCKLHNFKYIALAHHANDVVETFHINLARGTGIKGLCAMSAKNGNIIRPLLGFTRDEIVEYQQLNNIFYREDLSNKSTKYARNKIRHIVVPTLKEINNAYNQNVIRTIEHLTDVEKIYKQQIELKKREILQIKNNMVFINIEKLIHTIAPKTFLFEMIKDFGFQSDVLEQIYKSIENHSGNEFYSDDFKILRDRDYFIISENKNYKEIYFSISEEMFEFEVEKTFFKTQKKEKNSDFELIKNSEIAYIDYEKIVFPLTITHWNKGDYFYPLGMNKRKKLSDFFIDRKFSIYEKEKQLLLKSGTEIVWIVGKQIDNRFKVTDDTKKIFEIKINS
jgi:tRNA(Ile)-lysidine synthase